MYKLLSKTDLGKILGLSEDYRVDGVLSFGHYDVDKQLERIKNTLTNIGTSFQINRLNGMLQNIFELKINGMVYWFMVVYGGVTLSEYLHFACMFGSKKYSYWQLWWFISRNE